MNDLFSHVRSYHEYQSNIYWLPFKAELKTDKTFPPTFRKDPRSGTGLGRNYRKLRFPLREEEVEEREFYATDRSQNF